MSLYDPNDVCPTCGGLEGYAGARRPHHACKCPQTFGEGCFDHDAPLTECVGDPLKRRTLSITTSRNAA